MREPTGLPENPAAVPVNPGGPTCAVEWCTRKVDKYSASGWCNACWAWSRRHGGADPASPARRRTQPPPPDGRCTVVEDGVRCPEPHRARGMCTKHWQRSRKRGTPTAKTRRSPGELLSLVKAAARATSDECVLAPCDRSRPSLTYKGEPMVAARAVWWEAAGHDPGDRQVLHSCHRGDDGCINIRHLRLGDHAENMLDMTEAERQARGEENGNAELTEEAVRQIRRRYAAGGIGQRVLAQMYGVSQGTISQIIRRKTWKHLAG